MNKEDGHAETQLHRRRLHSAQQIATLDKQKQM